MAERSHDRIPCAIADPAPQRYLTDDPGIGGRLKDAPEDFIVEELPLYEPCGTGEHLYLRVRKIGCAHGEMMSCLRRTFGVPERAIGYAGMKDKVAVTTQTVSIHLPQDPPDVEIDHERISVLWSSRHRNKIRRGHLKGNRFSIRIRDVDPMQAPVALRTIRHLEQTGVPTYFGLQRFGYRANNHLIGAMVLTGDWEGILSEVLGAGGTPFPAYQRERRELFDAGDLDRAAAEWTAADRSELSIINALRRGWSPEAAVRAVGATNVGFWTSAMVSAAFNHTLDRRLSDGTVARLHEGDLAWKHDSRAVFPVTAETMASGTLDARLAALEISPSGPLWGSRMTRAGGDVAIVERAALEATGLTPEQMEASRDCPDGSRRSFRARLGDASVDAGVDERGPYIRAAFDLPRGIYATVALREVMKAGRA